MVCVKLAGREAGRKCVVVKHVDNNFVMIDGDVKRRKCNVDHLMTLGKVLAVKSNTGSDDIKAELIKMGLMVKQERKVKPQKAKSEKPVKLHKVTEKPELVEKKAPAKKALAKKPAKKAVPKKELKFLLRKKLKQ